MRPLAPWLALLLAGFEAGDPPPTPSPPAPPASPTPTEPGEVVLERAIAAMQRAAWEEALAIGRDAEGRYPELQASFAAVTELAADQLARRAVVAAQPSLALQVPVPAGHVRRHREEGVFLSLDVGLATDLGVEWKLAERTVDGVGFKFGAAFVMLYGSPYVLPGATVFADFATGTEWQISTSGGVALYDRMYPFLGVAAQWDPVRPIQVNLGVRASALPSFWVGPDVSVGWRW